MESKIIAVTDATFEKEVLQASTPVLVDFGAEWCHPCRQLDPIVEELAEEWGDKVKVVKIDVDSSVSSAMAYGVMGVPTLILFSQGEDKARLSGFQNKKRLLEVFGAALTS
jgi:thioredoxin 1